MTPETPNTAPPSAAAPAPKALRKIDHNGTAEPGSEEKWLEARIEEVHAEIAVVSLLRPDKSRVMVTVSRPVYDCEHTALKVGDKVLVRAAVIPPVPACAVIQGQHVHVAL